MILDNREIALLVWFALGAGYLLWKTRGGKALARLIRILLSRPILSVLGLTACYVAASVWLLSLPGWWQWSNVKTTLLWAGGFALVALFNLQRIESDKSYFRTVVLEAIGINAFLAFVISSHTFSLPVELAIVGALAFLVLISAISDGDDKLKPVSIAATFLLVVLSLLMLGNSIYHIATGFRGFATAHTIREFASPILLTVLFLPFLYGIYIYATYDRVFNSFNFSIKDPALQKRAKCKLIARFRLDMTGLEKWRRHVVLFPPASTSQIDESIDEIKQVRKREKRPYRVPPPLGWLPSHATAFLASVSLPTNDYHRTHDGWWACSRYLDLGKEVHPSNVAYYVEGDEFVVSKLKLVLNINAPESADQAYEHFSQTISLLVRAAIPGALKNGNELSISSDGVPLTINGYELILKRVEWPKGIKGGHEFVFTIEIAGLPSPLSAGLCVD